MKFYLTSVSIYAVLATLLIIALAVQNRSLKQSQDPVAIDWNRTYNINIDAAPTKGPEDAPVTIVEYSDFECHYCAAASTNVDQLMQAYPGKIRVVFKHLPLPFHNQALPAASAAMAAHVQGRFWEMRELLFQNQDRLGETFFTQAATDLNLELETFHQDRAGQDLQNLILSDAEEARTLEIQGTPTFFVNGVKIPGNRMATLKEAIERALKG